MRDRPHKHGQRCTAEFVSRQEFAARHRRIAALEHYATLAAGWDFEGWEHRRAAEKDPAA
ncbi:MAG: type II toxin-antitoxin system VapB family antitoxin [Streptosporangiales bacterium]